jgi:hypothetical protein
LEECEILDSLIWEYLQAPPIADSRSYELHFLTFSVNHNRSIYKANGLGRKFMSVGHTLRFIQTLGSTHLNAMRASIILSRLLRIPSYHLKKQSDVIVRKQQQLFDYLRRERIENVPISFGCMMRLPFRY